MKKIANNNIKSGSLYFYIHFVTEVICFFMLSRYTGNRPEIWLIFLSYDMLAFVPQAIIGRFSDRYPRIPLAAAGLLMMAVAAFCFEHISDPYFSLVILCIGNCLVHVNGAEVTLRTAEGRLSGSAIFVSGGSFGVVTGKILSKTALTFWPVVVLTVSALPMVLLAQRYISDEKIPFKKQCMDFDYAKSGIPRGAIVAMAVAIVAVRGFMGYGIPTSWNKTMIQTVLLFSFMGIGKAMGGILADRFGVRRTALVSTVVAAPLLMFGDNLMMVSLVGVMCFSMTMAITLAILVSVLPSTPGLAFGWTTIGLFVGSAPVFFFKITSTPANCMMIAVMSCVCLLFMWIVIKKDRGSE